MNRAEGSEELREVGRSKNNKKRKNAGKGRKHYELL